MPSPTSAIKPEFHTPRCDPFFDSDVAFPQSLPTLEGHVECGLVREVVWEEWAHRRVTKMVEKETQLTPRKSRQCGIPFQFRDEVVRWLLEFELCIKHYPPISPPTRHRAITMFSTFWSKRGLPKNLSSGDARLVACRSGVACMVLACKADIDVFQPLFVLSLNIWVSRVMDSGWISLDVNCLAAYERTILRELAYETTKATPFDLISELSIASPELENLMSHCGEDWELIEETFGIILEQSVQNQGYLQFRTSVMAAAALFLSMEGSLFDHPLDQMPIQGRQWVRDSGGTWHKTINPSSPDSVRVKIISDVSSNNHLIEVVEEDIKASIILIMGLTENEVERCKDWCAAL
ncbi:hypothetical protein DFH28DRAFT_879293 [Melampsora americana]|nr:hypothetical protein DFH28DRAFT_879293 [Melampsora americana]